MKENTKKFLKYVCENNKKKICISAIFVILVTVFDLYLPLLLKKIIDKDNIVDYIYNNRSKIVYIIVNIKDITNYKFFFDCQVLCNLIYSLINLSYRYY